LTCCQWVTQESFKFAHSLTQISHDDLHTGSMCKIESNKNWASSCTDVNMARLCGTSSTVAVAHRSPMLQANSVSVQPHSNDSGATTPAYHSWPTSTRCATVWRSGTLWPTTFAHSRTMSHSNRAWKLCFSLDISVHSAIEASWQGDI